MLIAQTTDFTQYLTETDVINFSDDKVIAVSQSLNKQSKSELEFIQKCFAYVRDEILHAWDIQSPIVTRKASEVLEKGTGICYAKANLLAALLRKNGIPCGFVYQRLMLFDVPEKGYCIHALNGIYVDSLAKWIVVDARGNKPGVNAVFSTDEPSFAFTINEQLDEKLYPYIYANPHPATMTALEQATDLLETYKYLLPTEI